MHHLISLLIVAAPTVALLGGAVLVFLTCLAVDWVAGR